MNVDSTRLALRLRRSRCAQGVQSRSQRLRGGGVSEAPQATPQPTCWLVTPGHIFVGLVTHPRVSHLHLRSSHAYLSLPRVHFCCVADV